jgi:hypothetical protein
MLTIVKPYYCTNWDYLEGGGDLQNCLAFWGVSETRETEKHVRYTCMYETKNMTGRNKLATNNINDPCKENDSLFSANVSKECGTTNYNELDRQVFTVRHVTCSKNGSMI